MNVIMIIFCHYKWCISLTIWVTVFPWQHAQTVTQTPCVHDLTLRKALFAYNKITKEEQWSNKLKSQIFEFFYSDRWQVKHTFLQSSVYEQSHGQPAEGSLLHQIQKGLIVKIWWASCWGSCFISIGLIHKCKLSIRLFVTVRFLNETTTMNLLTLPSILKCLTRPDNRSLLI